MQWFAQAPANIALIKYMGKKDSQGNIPDNASLSYTLNNLLSNVILTTSNEQNDRWEPLTSTFTLSTAAQQRFLRHLAHLKAYFNYQGNFIVQSDNNFPHSSGFASSASSFAALTRCAVFALSELTKAPIPSIAAQAALSRIGSGSSCRSFFSPWALWDEQTVSPIELPFMELLHNVIVINKEEKKVSSSNAHQRILSSPHYANRSMRAQQNLQQLLDAFSAHDWARVYQICWHEFQDMHQLFSTCHEPFSYITPESDKALTALQRFWEQNGDGPIVTMDAGPNIHLLYRMDQADLAHKFKQEHSYHVL